MLETMLALKNNDMRKIPGYDPEPVERLRKLQRTLVGDFHNMAMLPLKCATSRHSFFIRNTEHRRVFEVVVFVVAHTCATRWGQSTTFTELLLMLQLL